MKIGIVGAGIGGLTAALACAQLGFDVSLYERSTSLSPIGAGIQLGANATKALHALGLRPQLEAKAIRPFAVHLRSWKSSYLIAQRPLGQSSEERYGAPYYQLHRAELQNILLDAVQAKGINLHLGKMVSGLSFLEDGAELRFADGSSVGVDVAVGADGIHSTIRNLLHGESKPEFIGHTAWRATVPTAKLPPAICRPYATVYMGPKGHFVHYLVNGGADMNIVAVAEIDHWTRESWVETGDVEEMRHFYRHWHVAVRTMLAAATSCMSWALYDRAPMQQWHRGRVTLLGDACHPMLPFLAQGAAMAIEDGYILSRLLEHHDDPTIALSDYEKYRKPRTARVQLAARAQAKMFHEGRRFEVWKRNARLALGSRLLPDIAMAQLDWLYGYETVKGFSG